LESNDGTSERTGPDDCADGVGGERNKCATKIWGKTGKSGMYFVLK
jgi:hypothetical protein